LAARAGAGVARGRARARDDLLSVRGWERRLRGLFLSLSSPDLLTPRSSKPPPPTNKTGKKKKIIGAYGFAHVPMAPGTHDIDCLTWAPEGGALDRARAFLWGGATRLSDERAVAAAASRFPLQTSTQGVVRLRLTVIVKDFARLNVSLS
jgi:hypothetical protein